jgi:hypothetical protein
MTTLDDYLQNEDWAKFYEYSFLPPNGGHYKRWVQGSPGMMSGMPLYSNEYSYLYMKHGSNNNIPYRGGVKRFSPSVTPALKQQVQECSFQTKNPAGCQMSAIQQVYSYDVNPHPFGVSYYSGRNNKDAYIPPNSYQDRI